MLNRVDRVLIGKDIARDSTHIVAGLAMKTLVQHIADGELVVLDKDKKVLATGATISDSDTIYICQGTSKTFNFTTETGVAITGAREVKLSSPIQGKKVKSYKAKTYVAKAEQTARLTYTGLVPVAGTEYLVRIIYKDMEEFPSQFTQTYRHIATAADAADVDVFAASIAAKINKHKGRRVDATVTAGSDYLTLTAKEIPECCTSTSDIDTFKMVQFEVRFVYVSVATTTEGQWITWPSTSTTVTYSGPTPGSGNWEQVRDLEKAALPYSGVTNLTQFPIITPALDTVVDSYYDLIVIEHDQEYLSPGINAQQTTPLTTVIALATASTGINANNNASALLLQLNPWMASLPGAFANISI